jgi:geranylgeranyl diphosphate synthase type II
LPALDNDDLRRGRPTCHKVFGEAMAILAGDALLTRAFGVLAEDEAAPAERRVRLVAELSRAAGTAEGMIGGQVEDLEAEGRPVDADRLDYIHRSKTGALLRGSVRMGAIWAGADEAAFAGLDDYGRHVGFAFQIVDDILDVTADSATLGKTAGKDAEQQKATFPALYGLEESRRKAREHYEAACEAVQPLGGRALRLRQIAERVVTRRA